MMDSTDRELLRAVQDGIPLEKEPFASVAERLDITQDEVIARLRALLLSGVIRRFGARIDHRRAGITVNAMVAWAVPEDCIRTVGEMMGAYPEVTHCYERCTVPGRWEYNLFTMLHASDEETIDRHLRCLSALTGIEEYVVLISTREFKRAPVARIP
jgi:DNA-binding Lrp family transcriptional regulator